MEEIIEQRHRMEYQNRGKSSSGVNFWMILSIILITAIIVGGGVYFGINAAKKETPKENVQATLSPEKSPETTVVPASVSPQSSPSLVSVDANFNKYNNPNLGFSLNVLKNMVEPYGQCNFVNTNEDHSYRPKEASVPVKIFEDQNTVYIASEFFYKLTGETKENGKSSFSGCDKTTNSIQILTSDALTYHSPKWKIIVKNINNDSKLDQFLKDRYGSACSVGEKKEAKQTGVFDIKIKGDGLDPDKSKCFINYMTEVKYYPSKQKVAAWDLGQACSFSFPTYNTCLDQEMVDSFTFL